MLNIESPSSAPVAWNLASSHLCVHKCNVILRNKYMGKETKNAYTHNLYSRFNEPFSQLPRFMYIKKFNPIHKKKNLFL